jgi:hypothetical protein
MICLEVTPSHFLIPTPVQNSNTKVVDAETYDVKVMLIYLNQGPEIMHTSQFLKNMLILLILLRMSYNNTVTK